MILKLETRNFRKHVDNCFDFSPGLNVIRGSNELGKSTLVEAILYALYGSRVLRTSLEDAVTWGQKVSTLRVALTLQVEGVTYEFTRAKSGAEVLKVGQVFVTGQAEVSAFAADLLGADAKVAQMLMMAGQSDLRGALDAGPAAVSSLVAKVADFTLIDSLLTKADENLITGSRAPVVERLLEAEGDLGNIPEVSAEDREKAHQNLTDLLAQEEALREAHAAKSATSQAAQQALAYHRQALREHQLKVEALGGYRARIAALQSEITLARERAEDCPSAEGVQKAEEVADQVATASARAEQLRKVWLTLKLLVSWGGEVWEGSLDALQAGAEEARKGSAEARQVLADLNAQIRTTQDSFMKPNQPCPLCGTLKPHEHDIDAHNARLTEKLQGLSAQRVSAQQRLDGENTLLSTLTSIIKETDRRAPLLQAAAEAGLEVEAVGDTYPQVLVALPPQPDPVDPASVRAKARALAAKRLGALAAGEALTKSTRSLAYAEEDLRNAEESASRGAPQGEHVLLDAAHEAQMSLTTAIGWLNVATDLRKEAERRHQELEMLAYTTSARRDELAKVIARAKSDLARLEFGNALTKKLKALKPAITDHIWSNTLAAVSLYFSQMRGEPSQVTKDAAGFKVNGRGIESLSGSTLDALALAIRVALTKVFLPGCPVLILDEPAHGCDEERTGNVLGFLASCGFPQVILASHDNLSESVADNLIHVGD